MFGLAWLTGPMLYAGVGGLVVIIALSGALWVQTDRVASRDDTIKAMEIVAASWEQKVGEKEAKIESLQFTIDEQNKLIEDNAAQGELAKAKQREVDALQQELAQAKGDLKLISDMYSRMRDQAVGLNTCQTYEMVLRSIAKRVAP